MKRINDAPICDSDTKRFMFLKNEEELTKMIKPNPPSSTAHSTQWARRNFDEWRTARNIELPEDTVPPDLLARGDVEELNKWLSLYIIETRNSKGGKYPAKTIY